MATISDTSQASAQRLNKAIRNLGKDPSAARNTQQGFEVDDDLMAEYKRLTDEGDNDVATSSEAASQPSDDTADK
jgi:hypothetical protein